MSLGSVIPTLPLSIAAVPSSDKRTVIPGKLVKAEHIPTAFEPSPEFIASLTVALRHKMFNDILELGDHVHRTYMRGKRLHIARFNLPEGGALCPFKFAEEGFEWARPIDSKQITTLDWLCERCGDRHSVEVLE